MPRGRRCGTTDEALRPPSRKEHPRRTRTALGRPITRRRARCVDGYLADVLTRDVQQVAGIERTAQRRRLVALLTAQTAGLLNAGRLAGELTISAPTVRSYLSILETIFLVTLVRVWSSGATRAIGTAWVR